MPRVNSVADGEWERDILNQFKWVKARPIKSGLQALSLASLLRSIPTTKIELQSLSLFRVATLKPIRIPAFEIPSSSSSSTTPPFSRYVRSLDFRSSTKGTADLYLTFSSLPRGGVLWKCLESDYLTQCILFHRVSSSLCCSVRYDGLGF